MFASLKLIIRRRIY